MPVGSGDRSGGGERGEAPERAGGGADSAFSGYGVGGVAFHSSWRRCMLCWLTWIRPARGLSRSAIRASTTAIMSGETSMMRKDLRRMLEPTRKQVRREI